MPFDHEPATTAVPPAGDADVPAAPTPPIVDFVRAARRVRRSAVVLGSGGLVGWLLVGLLDGGPDPATLGAWGAAVLAGMFVVEVVVVGGSALRGMLRAGDRGERLAGGDVGLLPPQLTGRSPRRLQPREPER